MIPTTIREYLQQYAGGLASSIASLCQPLHTPGTDSHPRLADLKVKPFPKQADKINAGIKCLRQNGLLIDAGTPGSGKSACCIATAHCLLSHKAYRTLVLCPPHLTGKWKDEVNKFLGATRVVIIRDWKHYIATAHDKPTEPTWYIMAKTTAKLSGTRKVAPYRYAKARNIRYDLLIVDEHHEAQAEESQESHSVATFSLQARYTILASGTPVNGTPESLRPLLFRLRPRFFLDRGFGWGDEIAFAEKYGRLKTVTRKATKGKKSSKTTSKSVVAGIAPALFTDFIANHTVFLTLEELSADLPEYQEITRPIRMPPAQASAYAGLQHKLISKFRELYLRDRNRAVKMLGSVLETLTTWPDTPWGMKPVSVDGQIVAVPPSLGHGVTAKEAELLKIIATEKAEGRQVLVYCDRDATSERLAQFFQVAGLKFAHLTAEVKPADRLGWLKENAPGVDVCLANPALLATGVEVYAHDRSFNFPSLVFYCLGTQLNVVRQASARAYRIGQWLPCRTYFLYYEGTAQEKTAKLMASKLVAAESMEGIYSSVGLADEAVDDDIALQVAKELAGLAA